MLSPMYTLMARRAKPNRLPWLRMTTGGRRLHTLRARSLEGEESREEGLEDKDREDLGLVGGPGESSGVMTRERPDTEADFGTLQLAGGRGFSGVSSWWAMRRDAPLR